MQDPTALYRYETEALIEPRPGVLVAALAGFLDAGNVQGVLARHLLDTCSPEVVATFDVDQVLDYRGRRPVMVFDANRWASYDDPSLVLYRLTDREGETFYLLDGVEPDFQWERMAEAVREVMDRVGVTVLVTAHGIPMGVPHTRPVGMTPHGTDRALLGNATSPFGRVQVPGSFLALLELRLGELGRPAIGYAVHVPHYLAGADFAEGALTALTAVTGATGLNLPNDALVALAGQTRAAINSQVAENDEVRAVVRALEQQYDAFLAGRERPSLLATEAVDIPSADEIGAEFEEFLRTVSDDGDSGPI